MANTSVAKAFLLTVRSGFEKKKLLAVWYIRLAACNSPKTLIFFFLRYSHVHAELSPVSMRCKLFEMMQECVCGCPGLHCSSFFYTKLLSLSLFTLFLPLSLSLSFLLLKAKVADRLTNL